MAARLQHPEVASSFSQTPVSIPCPHDSSHHRDKKRPPDAGRDSKVLRSHRHSDERNDVGGVRSAIEDTLLDNGEETCLDRSDGAQYDRNDGAQPMNTSSTRRSTICADSRKSSSSPFATIVCADERSLTVNCNITDGKPFIKGDCKRLKIERAFHRNSCNFSKISTIGDFNIDKRVKKLAKKDTHLREDDLNLFQGSLFSAKEKRDDGDDGFAIVNSNTTCSKMEDEMVLNSREEHDCRQNEMFALSPESDLSCKVSHEGSGTSHLSTHIKVDHKSENYVLQSPECSLPEEDSIDEHSDYLGTALQGLSQEDTKGRKSSPQSESSPFVTNMLKACRSIHEYQRLSKINEGVHGVVFKAQNKKTGEVVAVKKVKLECEKDGFPITSIREINILLSMDHPSVVAVKEIAVDEDLGSVYMVMEHMEQDLAGLLATHKSPFSQSEVKYMMLQLLRGVEYIHSNWVLHRDLKPSNLLVDSQGMIKICDFGLARQYGSPLKTCTHKVVSLWYRDPALLLGSHKYSTAVDMWSVGCIMAELLGKVPLFKGCSELDQLKKIVAVLGRPDEIALQDKLPGVQFNFLRGPVTSMLREKFPPMSFTGKTPLSDSGFNLLSRLLMYDPNKRISAGDAVRHGWFRDDPLPKPSASY